MARKNSDPKQKFLLVAVRYDKFVSNIKAFILASATL